MEVVPPPKNCRLPVAISLEIHDDSCPLATKDWNMESTKYYECMEHIVTKICNWLIQLENGLQWAQKMKKVKNITSGKIFPP